jgi:hypothetical protein
MFEVLSTLLKYIFITIIYYFLFSIIKLIYLDIRSTNNKAEAVNVPYLKLINRRDAFNFKIEESYILKGRKVLGRSKRADIAIDDPFLSKEHAEFIEMEGIINIKDIGSKNGTTLNGEMIADEMSLNNGDRIDVGQISFLFVDVTPYNGERNNR